MSEQESSEPEATEETDDPGGTGETRNATADADADRDGTAGTENGADVAAVDGRTPVTAAHTEDDSDGPPYGLARYGGAVPDPPVGDDVDLSDQAFYLNRELAELSFHERVLNEALDDRNPPLERAKFLSIITRNLDEFFMKRVGGLKEQLDAGVAETFPDGRNPHETWLDALSTARDLFEAAARCWREDVRDTLAEAGVHVHDHDDLDGDEQAALRSYFEAAVLPTLTPLTYDASKSFPFISNLSLSLAVRTREGDGDPRFSRVKIPENRPRLVDLDDVLATHGDGTTGALQDDTSIHRPARFVPLEQVVAANLDLLFPNVEVLDAAPFRVTRNAEVRRNEDVAEGLIQSIEGVLRDRRFATVVRLEVDERMDESTRRLLLDQLELEERELFEREGPLDFRDLSRLTDLDRPDLKLPGWQPQPHPRFADHEGSELFAAIRQGDVLAHHPYHSFEGTVQAFLGAAARDDDVLAIKCAIYRTAQDSKVIESLIEAARNGKQVAVMVELKARFDEANNLRWVRRLEEEGIHVAYGSIGLKAHAKCALVVRDEGVNGESGTGQTGDGPAANRGVGLYSHVGTGNYHAGTAKLYADLGLLTADRRVGNDLVRLFNFFTGHSRENEYERLLVAPTGLRDRVTDLIRAEAAAARDGEGARIVAKLNALEDPAIVRELYEASMAGVEIDLVVRGICRLRPGIEGVSETVTVRSVVGRFLEHARIYHFENADPAFYIGSADWMTRNLDRRVEAVVPVEEPAHRRELASILDLQLADTRRAWEMGPDGDYRQHRPDGTAIDTHETLMARASQGAAVGDPAGFEDVPVDVRESLED
ncbi:polyphosphate kinase 1 [Haloglomus litoreum]|uniref:polyphosphate kinase 1 n=1 Tax=Haloglomus litoreum TaxID=3034026 RepID=UPI0023E78C26|nr:polyphosphate kinase 1 [Haloglomus sp. DT116]